MQPLNKAQDRLRNPVAHEPTARFARYVAALRYEDLPRPLVDLIKQCVLDTLGVAIAATTLSPEAKIVAQYSTYNPIDDMKACLEAAKEAIAKSA